MHCDHTLLHELFPPPGSTLIVRFHVLREPELLNTATPHRVDPESGATIAARFNKGKQMKYPLSLFKPERNKNVDYGKRRALKFIGGYTALAGTVASTAMSQSVFATESTPTVDSEGHNSGRVSINIMTDKSMAYDWILMENLSNNPLEIKVFNPGLITYLGKQLDLNQLLSANATNGALQLHSDYAWSESLYGLSDRPFDSLGQQLVANDVVEAISADTRVVRCWANVVDAEAEVFIGDPPATASGSFA